MHNMFCAMSLEPDSAQDKPLSVPIRRGKERGPKSLHMVLLRRTKEYEAFVGIDAKGQVTEAQQKCCFAETQNAGAAQRHADWHGDM